MESRKKKNLPPGLFAPREFELLVTLGGTLEKQKTIGLLTFSQKHYCLAAISCSRVVCVGGNYLQRVWAPPIGLPRFGTGFGTRYQGCTRLPSGGIEKAENEIRRREEKDTRERRGKRETRRNKRNEWEKWESKKTRERDKSIKKN